MEGRQVTRAERRRAEEAASAQRAKRQRTPVRVGVSVRTWWIYPVLAVIAVCVILGVRSVGTAPTGPPVVVTTAPPSGP